MAIKMGVNTKRESTCHECGKRYNDTKEMYNLMLCNKKFILCFDCVETLFKKTLSASVKYNNKLKSKEDMARIKRDSVIKKQFKTQTVEYPSCYGEFAKTNSCKKCKYNAECRDVFYGFEE